MPAHGQEAKTIIGWTGPDLPLMSAPSTAVRPREPEARRPAADPAADLANYKFLAEHARDVISRSDAQGRVVFVSPSVEALLGFKPEELVGRTGRDFVHPDDLPIVAEVLRSHVQPGTLEPDPQPVQIRARHRDGHYVWVEAVSRVLREADGSYAGSVTVTRDVTARRRVEEALRRESALVQAFRTVAIAANESKTLAEAARVALRELCTFSGWPLGHLYVRAGDRMEPSDVWHPADPSAYRAFRDATMATPLARGIGLPGRVLASARPLWIVDVSRDANFPRAAAARACGLGGGFAFPILVDNEVEAVLEFFNEAPADPDPQLLDILANVAVLLGRVVERERNDREVREMLSVLSATLEATEEGIVVVDREGRITAHNSKYVSMWHVAREALATRRADRVLAATLSQVADPGGYVRRVAAIDGQPEAESLDFVELRDGRLFEQYSHPQRVGGVAVGRVWSFRDVTARRSLERRIAENEEHLRLLAENATDMITLHDRDGTCLYVSPACRQLLGYEPSELLGRPRRELFHPDDLRIVSQMHEIASEIPEMYTLAFRYRRKDGSFVWLETTHRTLRSPTTGEVDRTIAVSRDITDRMRAEEERRRALAQLQELDAAKTRFLNTAAHELGTPLTPIRLQLDLLRERLATTLPAGERRALDILDRNVTRLTQLVAELLDVTRVSSGRMTIQKDRTDLSALVREAAEAFEEPARKAGVRLSCNAPRGLWAEVDAKRILQVLYNLLGNAVKFTPAGGKIELRALVEDGRAVVRVADNGRGVSPEDLPKLFQPFTQVGEAEGPGRAGTGLGLYISRGIVELHGGTIACESEGPNQGATFTVALPLK